MRCGVFLRSERVRAKADTNDNFIGMRWFGWEGGLRWLMLMLQIRGGAN
jgi:hypothetical protein